MKQSLFRFPLPFLLALLVAGVTSCNDSTTGPSNAANVTFTLKTSTTPGSSDARTAIVLQSAKVLLKQVKFHNALSDDSLDVKVGPVAVLLALSGGSTEFLVSPVPAGLYDQVRFHLHKPEDSEPIPDPEFREGSSGDQRFSVIVRGEYNGVPFVYKSRRNTEQRMDIAPPLSVEDGVPVNVTLVVDPNMWFTNNGVEIDPTDPQNADMIDDLIKASFRSAFKDNDRDGIPD